MSSALNQQDKELLSDVATEFYILLNENLLPDGVIIHEPEPVYGYLHPHMMGEPGFSQDTLEGFRFVVAESIVEVLLENNRVAVWLDNKQLGAWHEDELWNKLGTVAQQIAQLAQEPIRHASRTDKAMRRMRREAARLGHFITNAIGMYEDLVEDGEEHHEALMLVINSIKDEKQILEWVMKADSEAYNVFMSAQPIPGIPISYVSEAFYDGLYTVLDYYLRRG